MYLMRMMRIPLKVLQERQDTLRRQLEAVIPEVQMNQEGHGHHTTRLGRHAFHTKTAEI